MLKLRKLIKEHTWDREFGDPLLTFEDVMEKHQVNKLKEGWWDNMNAASQAAYIKKHPGSKQAQQADDDKGGGDNSERLGQISQEKSAAEKEMAHAEEVGDKNAYADAEQKLHDLEQEEEGLGGSGEPDKKDDLGKSYPAGNAPPNTSKVDSFSSQKHLDNSLEQQKEYERHLNRWAEEAADNDDDEALEKIQKLMDDNKKEQERLENDGASEADVAGDDDYDMGEVPGSRGTGPWTPEDDPDFEHGPSLTSAPGRVPDEEPSGEEGGEQNIPSDDEIDSYQEKLNTYTGPYSDGNEIHTKWEGITTKVWAETSEEAYKDDPDHPLNKPSDSEWADTVGEEVKGLASVHFSDFGDELKDASPEAKAYFKEKGLPPSDEQGRTGKELDQETLTIDGKQFRRISEGVEKQPKPKYAFSEFYQRFKRQE